MNPPGDRDALLFEYASFLATAARGSLEEGVHVASFRLADAIVRLASLFPSMREDAFFGPVLAKLDDGLRPAYFAEDREYRAFLDEVIVTFAQEIRRREGLNPG